VSGEHGIPQRTAEALKNPNEHHHLVATPLAQGRVCVAGYFDSRGWIGVATFDPKSGPR
jgi:hypothetical protein